MAYANDDVLFSAIAAHGRATDHSGTQTTRMMAVVGAIRTAVASGAFTASYDASGAGSMDLQFLVHALVLAGYTVSNSAGTLTITW